MVNVSQNQIVGSILPNVYISKIILQSSGDEVVESNPHVDVAREPDTFVDPRTGKVKRRFVQPNFARKSKESEKLNVTVEVVLKEKILDGLFTNWFGDVDFSKYIRVRLIQITDGNLARYVAQSINFLDVVDVRGETIQTPSQLVVSKFNLARNLNLVEPRRLKNISRLPDFQPFGYGAPKIDESLLPQISQLEKAIRPSFYKLINDRDVVASSTISVGQETPRDPREIRRQYRETDSDGNEIYNFLFRRVFTLNQKNPENLSYFAFAFLDLQQLRQDFDLGKVFPKNNTIGNVANEVVIRDGEIASETSVFYSGNEIWAGPIQRSATNELVGVLNSGLTVPLRQEFAPNSKVQDFRNFDDLEKVKVDFSLLESELNRLNIINPRREGVGFQNPKGYFSNFSTARDEEGNVRFFFSVDYRKLLQDYTNFGKLLRRRDAMRFILQDSAILGMKIIRRRVAGSPEIGSAQREDVFFTDSPVGYGRNSIDKTIAVSGEKSFGSFVEVEQANGSLAEIESVNLQNIDDGSVRHFTGIDRSIATETDGYYRYEVQLEVKDAGYNFLKRFVIRLEEARQRLNAYYAEATSLGSNSTQVPLMNPHVDVPQEEFLVKGQQRKTTFDLTLNRFSQSFIENQRNRYYGRSLRLSPWLEAIFTYVEGLRIFSDAELDYSLIQRQLTYFASPTTGTPAGIEKLLKLIESLQKNIEAEIGISAFGRGDIGESLKGVSSLRKDSGVSKSRIQGNNTLRTFRVNYLFKDVLNSNLVPQRGFDFLNTPTEENVGLKVITGEQYRLRAQRELDTYFNITDSEQVANVDIAFGNQFYTKGDNLNKTAFSYLSPARIKLGVDDEINRIGNSPQPIIPELNFQNIAFKVRTVNSPIFNVPTKNKLKSTKLSLKKDTIDFFSVYNVSVEPISTINAPRFSLPDQIGPRRAGRPAQKIDALQEKQQRRCDFDEDVINNENLDPTQLLLELAKRTPLEPRVSLTPFLGKGPSGRTITPIVPAGSVVDVPQPTTFNPQPITVADSSLALQAIQPIERTIRAFDLSSEQNSLNKLVQQPSLVKSDTFFQGAPHNTNVNDAVSALPIQIKSLFLSRVKPEIIQTNWVVRKEDALKGPGNDVRFNFDYNMLRTVQVLRGYEVDKNGLPLVRKPLWEPLTIELYNRSIGQNLICRLTPYENKVLEIRRQRDLELMPFDEYFVLRAEQPVESVIGEAERTLPQAVPLNVQRDFEKEKEQEAFRLIEQDRKAFALRAEYLRNITYQFED
jgi:hypothetical protein